jgi:hypothetical protein
VAVEGIAVSLAGRVLWLVAVEFAWLLGLAELARAVV